MNTSYCIRLLLLTAVFCQTIIVKTEELQKVYFDENFNDNVQEFQEKLETKCQQSRQEFSKEKFDNAIEITKNCLEEYLPKNEIELEAFKSDSNIICSEKRITIRNCIKNIIGVIEDCLTPEEKYFPTFLLDSLKGIFDLMCQNDREIWSQILSDNIFECVSKVIGYHFNKITACIDKFRFLINIIEESFILKKEDLCYDLKEAKSCYTDIANEICPECTEAERIIAEIYKAVASPCI